MCVRVATTLGVKEQALTHALLLIKDEQAVFPSIPIPPLDLSSKRTDFSQKIPLEIYIEHNSELIVKIC